MNRYVVRLIAFIIVTLLHGWLNPGLIALAEKSEPTYALGLIPSPPGDYPQARLLDQAGPLPQAIDLSSRMPPIGDQEGQASCVGWAIAYYYRSHQEGVENRRTPDETGETFSPAFIYNQRITANCYRDAGMTLVNGLRIAVEQGVATLATMPYNPSDTCTQPSAEARAEAWLYRSAGYVNLFANRGTANLTLLKQHLATGDPFLLAVPVYSEFRQATAQNPVIDLPAPGSAYLGGHAITVVGYDEVMQTFKFANSWGTNWGDNGYAYLTYDFLQQKAWEAWYLIDTDTTPPSPPVHAFELGGTQSNVVQSEVNNPAFIWARSQDPTAYYQVYWGNNPQGTAELSVSEPFFAPDPVSGTTVHYLRVRALDAAGNASHWCTLFTFWYSERAEEQERAPLLQPVRFH